MKRRARNHHRQKQINILHTTTRKRHSRKQLIEMGVWCGVVLAMIVVVGVTVHIGLRMLVDRVLFNNPRYQLAKIDIEPAGHFSPRMIRQAAGLDLGENLWTLNLRQIAQDVETLPNVSSARVERHFPDRLDIHITERVPVVKIVGLDIDLGTKETFYLDREGIVLKPRDDDTAPPLPEIIGLSPAQDELEPGMKLDEPNLSRALEIMDAIDHSRLHTSIDIGVIDLSNPLSITMTTRQEMKITFRLDYLDQQLQRLVQIVEYADSQGRTLQSVDLTPDFNVPVTFCQNQ
jgi:cell division protein FtsQ